ncbi:MAG: cadherin-like beta sandwich domain-containing protein [bacterium]
MATVGGSPQHRTKRSRAKEAWKQRPYHPGPNRGYPRTGVGFSDRTISIAAIAGVAAPVRDAAPVAAITETDQYTGTVSWTPAVGDKFAASTAYTATITLTAKAGYTLTGVAEYFFTVAGATATNAANSGVVTAVFPATEAALSSDAGLTSVAGQTDGSPGAQTGADADNAITWALDVANEKASLGRDDIAVAADATFNLYSDAVFTTEVEDPATLALAVGDTVAYIKVTAEDGTTVKYYAVTIIRAAA